MCQEQYLGQIIFDDIGTFSNTTVKQNEPVAVFGQKWPKFEPSNGHLWPRLEIVFPYSQIN